MIEFDSKRQWGPTPKYPNVLGTKKRISKRLDDCLFTIAGPCSVENEEQMLKIVRVLSSNNVTYARGGVYRAGTYPPSPTNFGLQEGLAQTWSDICHGAGLEVVMECLDVRQVDFVARWADAIQVGARHMQDYALLKEVSAIDIPVFLKRNPGSTLDEFLGACEYLAKGKCWPVLIERGGSTHMNHVRWDLSISLIAAVKMMTGIPIIVDASHGTGRRDLVRPMTLAGIAAGADGFLVEVHPDPEKSLSDADQAYPLGRLQDLIIAARAVQAVSRG